MPEGDKKDDVKDKKQDVSDDTGTQQPEPEVKTQRPKDLAEAMQLLAKQSEQMEKDAALLKKVRKYEKENKEQADAALKEQGKYKELYDTELGKRQGLELKVRDGIINSAVEKVLKEKNVTLSLPTALKLLDRSKVVIEDDEVDTKSIQAQLDALKKSDPTLFGGTKLPDVKRPGEGDPVGGYEKELRAAKSQKEIDAVLKKHGKI